MDPRHRTKNRDQADDEKDDMHTMKNGERSPGIRHRHRVKPPVKKKRFEHEHEDNGRWPPPSWVTRHHLERAGPCKATQITIL